MRTSVADARTVDDRGGAAPGGAGARHLPRRAAARAGGRWRGIPRARRAGIGWFPIRATEDQAEDELFGDLPASFYAFEWHHFCFTPPEDATLIYNSRRFNQAFRFGRNAWGTQFHFEAEPATVYDWIDTARDEAITHGVDVPNLRATTAQYGPTQVELCHRVALRFVEVVGRYAGAR